MRVIDADTAISLIQEDKIEGKTLDIMKALGDDLQAETLNLTCDRHIKIISSLPTLEVEPVRHGHWIDDNTNYYYANCSICGYEIDVHVNRGYHNYCPNCGAKMDEEDEQS